MVSSGVLGLSDITQFIHALSTYRAMCVRWGFGFSRSNGALSVGVDMDVDVGTVDGLFWLGMAL